MKQECKEWQSRVQVNYGKITKAFYGTVWGFGNLNVWEHANPLTHMQFTIKGLPEFTREYDK